MSAIEHQLSENVENLEEDLNELDYVKSTAYSEELSKKTAIVEVDVMDSIIGPHFIEVLAKHGADCHVPAGFHREGHACSDLTLQVGLTPEYAK